VTADDRRGELIAAGLKADEDPPFQSDFLLHSHSDAPLRPPVD
jgi:hypothetical protein